MIWLVVSIVLAFAVVPDGGPAWSAVPSTLEELSAAIESASKEPDGDRVVVGHLSRKLAIPVETLRTQRMQTGLGWGDLLLANRISREAQLSFDQVVAELKSGRSWTEIARDRVDPAKVISEVQQSLTAIEQHTEDRTPYSDTGKKADKSTSSGGTGRSRRH